MLLYYCINTITGGALDNYIEIKNLTKLFVMGDEIIRAIDDLSLSVSKGKIICILGKSGSGKTTLLNLIAGLEKPTKGSIKIGNIVTSELNEDDITTFRRLNIGFVFQSYNLIPTLSASENVSLGLTFKGVSKKNRMEMAYKALKSVGLEDRMNHKPNELSGGQQQRVSIARAFVGNPKIIFADEPTGNLDTKTSEEVMEIITGLAKEKKQTLIIVTHDEEITSFADITIHMRDGKIEKIEENEV